MGERVGASAQVDTVAAPWFAIHTQPQREHVAETYLQRRCVRVFCPRYRQRVILHGYRREVARPLFPGYLFAAFDPTHDLKLVHYARGVRGVVAFGGQAAEVPVALLHSIEARMHEGFVVLPPPPLHVGQPVEIIAGPLKGFRGILASEVSSAQRVAILLDTLKYNARAVIDRAAVRALG